MIRFATTPLTFEIRKPAASLIVFIMSIGALAGCANTPPLTNAHNARTSAVTAPPIGIGNVIADRALEMLGVPYRFGGESPDVGFDCSGLVYFTYTSAGIEIPRVSQEQFKRARKISYRDIRDGDLVFFQDQTKLSHVGIYVGNGMFIHAPSSGKSVSLADISAPYYQRHLVAVGRLLPN